jgi:hypothetical protein
VSLILSMNKRSAHHMHCYQLHLLQNTVFLRPPTVAPNEDAPPTANDEVARGMVELFVPNDRKLGGIRVKLRAVQSVAILPDEIDGSYGGSLPMSWEDTVLMEKVVEIGLPKSKSHVTIPGDDVANSGENRGRSRATRSRNATPSASRAASPNNNPNAPPEYQEEDTVPVDTSSNGIAGLSSAFARAMSRGRPSGSNPSSQPNSRSVSRSVSRAASRNTSPSRPRSGHATPDASNSPRTESIPLDPSPSSSSANLTRMAPNAAMQIPRSDSARLLPSPGEDYDMSPLGASLSRTGLSNGRSQASSAHVHDNDREDRYGVVPPVHGVFARGRGGVGSGSDMSGAGARSSTMSPSRGFGWRGRDQSKSRLAQVGKKSIRSPSVDTGYEAIASSSSASDDAGGLDLQKGVHGFEFAFIIPADSAPYERSPYGRVRYIIKATAFGAGRAKTNLEAWRDLVPVVNPSPEGGPTALTILYNDLHPTVGLISIACTSNNISVGGIFNVDIHSPTPPTDLIVYLVRVSIETSVELRTRKKGKQKVPAQRHKLFEKGWVPPRPSDPHGPGDGKKSEGLIRDPTKQGCRSDDAWTVQGLGRMPNDNVVRSSTLPRTRAAIRFTHHLLIEVVHSREPDLADEERKLKVFSLRQPIVLPSCCVAYDAVSLPAYTPDYDGDRPSAMPYDLASHGQQGGLLHHTSTSSNPTEAIRRSSSQARSSSRSRWIGTATPTDAQGHDFCVCGQSIQDLSERERTLMPAVPHAELPLDGLSHRKIGELPEPTSTSNRVGSTLRRSLSRSSVNSNGSRRSQSRSLSRVRSAASTQRNNNGGERGEGVIRTMSRGARASELPGEAAGHHINGITNPPTYHEIVSEEQEGETALRGDERGRAAA